MKNWKEEYEIWKKQTACSENHAEFIDSLLLQSRKEGYKQGILKDKRPIEQIKREARKEVLEEVNAYLDGLNLSDETSKRMFTNIKNLIKSLSKIR